MGDSHHVHGWIWTRVLWCLKQWSAYTTSIYGHEPEDFEYLSNWCQLLNVPQFKL